MAGSGVQYATDGAETVGEVGGRSVGVVRGPVHQTLEGVQLGAERLQGVLGEVQNHVRLRLAHDTADVLAAQHLTVVDAVGRVTAAAPGDTAHVVAHMLIADDAGVDAAEKHTGGIAGDATSVGGYIDGVKRTEGKQLGGRGQIQVGQVDTGVHAGDVHIAVVPAGGYHAQIHAGDAAGTAASGDTAGGGTASDGAGEGVGAHDAAHAVFSGHGAGEGAVFNQATAASCDTAHIPAAAGGLHRAADPQVPDHGALLEDAEQSGGGQIAGQVQTGDGVAAAVKGAAEGGDGGVIGAAQGDVGPQHHGLVPGPGVQGALRRQGQQVPGAVDVNGAAVNSQSRRGGLCAQ